MNKVFKKVLLIYKKSAYSIYFMERKIQLARGKKANLQKEISQPDPESPISNAALVNCPLIDTVS